MTGTAAATVAVVAFLAVYALLVTDRVERVAVALGGAAVVVALGVVGAPDVFYSQDVGIDWNVLFLLFGMMVIVGGLRRTGLFEFVAIWAVKRARGRPYVVLALLGVSTAVAAAFLANVTTVLLVAPVTLLVCERLGLPAVPYLIAEAMAANIGGAASLVGDPANTIIASRSGLTFDEFLVHQGPVVVVVLAGYLLLARVLFRHAFVTDAERVAAVMALDEREAIRDRLLLRRGLAVLALVVLGFVLQGALGYAPSVVAMLGAGLMWLITREGRERLLDHVEWETLAFLAGLFIVVGALVKVGAVTALADAMARLFGDNALLATVVVLVGSAVVSGIVDNIPYVATMAPVIADLSDRVPALNPGGVLWWALSLGAVLGGNATAVGASSNVVVVGIARRNRHPIGFWEFARYGSVVAAMSVLIALPYLWLRYLS